MPFFYPLSFSNFHILIRALLLTTITTTTNTTTSTNTSTRTTTHRPTTTDPDATLPILLHRLLRRPDPNYHHCRYYRHLPCAMSSVQPALRTADSGLDPSAAEARVPPKRKIPGGRACTPCILAPARMWHAPPSPSIH